MEKVYASLKHATTGLLPQLESEIEETLSWILQQKLSLMAEMPETWYELETFRDTLVKDIGIYGPALVTMERMFAQADMSQLTSHPGWRTWLTIGVELISALLVSHANPAMIPPASIGISAKLTIPSTPDSQLSARLASAGAALQLTLEDAQAQSTPEPTTSTPSPTGSTSPEPGDGKSS